MSKINNMIKSSTFGVELELCACLYEFLLMYFEVKSLEKISKPIPKKLKTKWEKFKSKMDTPFGTNFLDRIDDPDITFTYNELLDMYYNMVLSDKKCDEKFFPEHTDDTYSSWVITKDESILCGIKELTDKARDKKHTLNYIEEFKDDLNSSVGIILPKNDKEYIKTFNSVCEKNMLAIEIISKKYLYGDLDRFLNTLNNCIFHDDIIYEINTSQGLHISIGNELVHSLDDDRILDWFSNLINLWYKFEGEIFKLIPKFRHNNRYSKPIHSVFKSVKDLNKISKKNKYNKRVNKYKYPEWALFYARNMDAWGYFEDDDRPKYSSINIKGLSFVKRSPDINKIIIDKNPYIEFRLLSSGSDIDLLSHWITFLTYFSTISLDEKSWLNAMKSKNLSGIFPSSLKDGKDVLKYIKENVNSNVLYKLE